METPGVEAAVRSFLELYRGSAGDAEAAAEALRDEWGMGSGPIGDLTGQLVDRGVWVLTLPLPGFDGFSGWINGCTPVIVCSSGSPGDRQRFSLAHELGHLLLQVRSRARRPPVYRRPAGTPGSGVP